MQVEGRWVAPLEPLLDMEDWLPFLGMLGLLPIEKEMASQRITPVFPVAWQALYERRLLEKPNLRAGTPASTRR